jgi:hypothetical protein
MYLYKATGRLQSSKGRRSFEKLAQQQPDVGVARIREPRYWGGKHKAGAPA